MKRALFFAALAVGLAGGIALAGSRQIGPTVDDTSPDWTHADIDNQFDGGAKVVIYGKVSLPGGAPATPPVISIVCTGPTAWATLTTCYAAWKTANGLP